VRFGRLHALTLTSCLALALAATPALAQQGLQPFQMVRSLQLVQDRIANGDHAALPMQRKLLEMSDERLRTASAEDLADRRNFRALLVYAMSGGNPTTLEVLLPRLDVDDADRQAASAVLNYLNGNVAEAGRAFARLQPETQHGDVAASLALLKGAVMAREQPRAALDELDFARLAAPGTLVEEAALRRSIGLFVALDEPERFMLASSQYVRRFLRSPYAAQFAEDFVTGVSTLSDRLDMAAVEEIIDGMNAEQARTLYLRLARTAAIEGRAALLEFASARAGQIETERTPAADTRSQLYASISSITSENVDQVLRELERLDAAGLTAQDRALLDAARAVAREVLAPTPGRTRPAPAPEPLEVVEATDEQGVAEGDAQTDELLATSRARLSEIDALLDRSTQ
jgi:chemotaxis protein MotC